jgi:uncharacterized membrane protein
MKKYIISLAILLIFVFFIGCKKTDTTPAPIAPAVDSCAGVTITPIVTKDFTITGQSLGTITVTSPIGSGFTYSITGTTFQGSTNFFNLAAGSYTVTAKNANKCTGITTVTINSYGPKYYEVRKIINGYCGPCHLNGTTTGGQNFDADNSIVAAWARIKVRSVDGAPSFMPQGGQLTALDKQKILDWVNAGHLITN